MPDLITLMSFEAGEMEEQEIAEMISEMLEEQGYDNLEGKFLKLAKEYIKKGIMDEEGNINYIKLKEEL